MKKGARHMWKKVRYKNKVHMEQGTGGTRHMRNKAHVAHVKQGARHMWKKVRYIPDKMIMQ